MVESGRNYTIISIKYDNRESPSANLGYFRHGPNIMDMVAHHNGNAQKEVGEICFAKTRAADHRDGLRPKLGGI